MQFLYLLFVYLTSSLPSKYDVVVILNSIPGPKEKENWRVPNVKEAAWTLNKSSIA